MADPADDLARLHGLVQPQTLTSRFTNRELARILKDASSEASQRIDALIARGTFSAGVKAEQLRAVRDVIDPLSTQLWNRVGQVTEDGMHAQAKLAADQALDRDWLMGMPGREVASYARVIHYDADVVVRGLMSRRSERFGKTLAERIYANGRRSTAAVGRIVDRALVQQLSARELSRLVRMHYAPNVPGGTSYAAMRLARTEINNAHHATTITLSESKPWVLGYKWNLSGSHPRPDECDELAGDDHDGMGPGIFAQGNAPGRPHPNCLCYLTHIQEPPEVFTKNLLRGDYDRWLRDRT